MSAITVQTAEEEILNAVVFQTFYRQLGMVAIHFGVDAMYNAATYLSTTPRGGTVSWVIEHRLFQWDGLNIAPGLPDNPTMSLWGLGSAKHEKNTAFIRKGWWSLYLPNVVGIASLVQTFRARKLS